MKRIYKLKYFELVFYLGRVLLLEHDGDHIVPKSLYMKSLVNAVIGDHFSLYDTGDELNGGKTLPPNVIKMNGRVGNHLTGLLFTEYVPKEAGGFDQDGNDAFGLYCETSGLKIYQNWTR